MEKQQPHEEKVREGVGDPAKERTLVDPPADNPERELPEVDETAPDRTKDDSDS